VKRRSNFNRETAVPVGGARREQGDRKRRTEQERARVKGGGGATGNWEKEGQSIRRVCERRISSRKGTRTGEGAIGVKKEQKKGKVDSDKADLTGEKEGEGGTWTNKAKKRGKDVAAVGYKKTVIATTVVKG